jgi:predicted lipoprotein with Yx(FWY)xxD motif
MRRYYRHAAGPLTGRRVLQVALPTAALALALAACGSSKTTSAASPSTTTRYAPPATSTPGSSSAAAGATGAVTLTSAMSSSLGTTVVVGPDGHTLYTRTDDTSTTTHCTGSCTQIWPPLLTSGTPVAGSGINASLLGTLERPGGGTQVTYDGHPLYYFASDRSPGQAGGEGVGHIWYAVSAGGTLVMGAQSTTSTTMGSSGGAYGGY